VTNVAEILDQKGRETISIDGDATVFEAVKRMVDANVGAVLVTGTTGVEGIFTERDYLRRIAVEGRTSRDTYVRDVMSSPVIIVTADTSIDEAMAIMTDRKIRHVPVVDGGNVIGMISIGDLVAFQSKQQSFQLQYLTEYISAR
jgi:CBS domain-containing protein